MAGTCLCSLEVKNALGGEIFVVLFIVPAANSCSRHFLSSLFISQLDISHMLAMFAIIMVTLEHYYSASSIPHFELKRMVLGIIVLCSKFQGELQHKES
jgi:hypothetical protein